MSKLKQLEIKGVTYDIQDALIPDTLGTAGQVVKVNSGRTGLEYGGAAYVVSISNTKYVSGYTVPDLNGSLSSTDFSTIRDKYMAGQPIVFVSGLQAYSVINVGGAIANPTITILNVYNGTPSQATPIYITYSASSTTPTITSMSPFAVGAIYISTISISPATLFGGSWEAINGRFLLASSSTYTAGTTGGEATHTLTVNEMPSHSHNFAVDKQYGTSAGQRDRPTLNWEASYSGEGLITSTGGGQAHNNMPPYLVVYMWKRIA